MADATRGVSCPLCGEQFYAAAPYAAHLAETHGLVDEEGAETALPEPEPEPDPERDPRTVVQTEAPPDPPPSEHHVDRKGRPGRLTWRRSLTLAIKTVALLVLLASAVAVVASLAAVGD